MAGRLVPGALYGALIICSVLLGYEVRVETGRATIAVIVAIWINIIIMRIQVGRVRMWQQDTITAMGLIREQNDALLGTIKEYFAPKGAAAIRRTPPKS